ncbi:hypothetical protein J2S48_000630 [Promicromonospora iranensis]|uniref:Uncharacterized protein n=1 Tax=Promicromonospora iranensis TaxID=1105144 RepID=A0ABU2CIF1_9MICO|nr:hypothetical protein [Promicromonospora iranensis]
MKIPAATAATLPAINHHPGRIRTPSMRHIYGKRAGSTMKVAWIGHGSTL